LLPDDLHHALQRAGVERRVLIAVARHEDSGLTDVVHTAAERLDLREAIGRLPALGEDSQNDAHGTVPERHSMAPPGTNGELAKKDETADFLRETSGFVNAQGFLKEVCENGAGGNRTPVP